MIQDADKIENILRRSPVLALDSETDGLDWRQNHSIGYVVTWGPGPEETTYLPFQHTGGKNLRWDPRKLFKKVLAPRSDVKLWFFNAAFDLKFFHQDSIDFEGRLEDGQINAFILNQYQPGGFSLDASCRYAGVAAKKGSDLYLHLSKLFGGEPTRQQMGNFHLLPGNDPLGVEYAAGDGTSTWQLLEYQQAGLDELGVRRIWDIECRLIRTLHRMTTRGVKIDLDRLEQIKVLTERHLKAAMEKLPKDFNVRAPSMMKKLFQDAGVTDWPMTEPTRNFPQGQPSFTKEWLQKSETGRAVVAAREYRHLKDSFLGPIVERHLFKGRVHCHFNQTLGEDRGTITGRLSASDPNLQQIPKRNKLIASVYRAMFIPDEGMIWGAPDYSQCEPRLLAHYGQVKVLLDGYLSTPAIDAHNAVALAAKIDRESGKRLNQALITGAGMAKVKAMLGRPVAEAEDIVRKYFQAMPEIKPFQKKAAAIWRVRPLRSLLGRQVFLDDVRFDYKALNRLLQVGNADVIKKAMVEVDEYYRSEGDVVHLLNNVHDALDHQFHEEHRAQYSQALEIMQDFGPGKSVELMVPLTVDADEGPNWAVATFGEKIVRESWAEMGESYDRPTIKKRKAK